MVENGRGECSEQPATMQDVSMKKSYTTIAQLITESLFTNESSLEREAGPPPPPPRPDAAADAGVSDFFQQRTHGHDDDESCGSH